MLCTKNIEQLDVNQGRALFSSANHVLSDTAELRPRRDGSDGKRIPGEYWLNDQEYGRTYRIFSEGDYIKVGLEIVWPQVAVGVSKPSEPGTQWRNLHQYGSVAAFYLEKPWPISDPFVVAYKFAGLDILAFQNATGSTTVSRNEDLLAKSPTSDAFRYKNPESHFPGIVTPLLKRNNIDLQKDGKTDPLKTCLSNFFDDLTASVRDADAGREQGTRWTTRSDADGDSILRMSLRNDFKFILNKAEANAVRSPALVGPPMLFSPKIDFNVLTDWKPDPKTFVTDLSAAVESRSAELKIPEKFGRYTFNLQVYSSIDNASQTTPLVDISNIYFTRLR